MLKPRSNVYLAAESIEVEGGSYIGWQNFYDHLPVEVYFGRNENTRHARAAELSIDSIAGAKYFLKLRG
jgi:hypothetical protein